MNHTNWMRQSMSNSVRYARHAVAILIAILAVPFASAPAQSADDRRTVDAFRDSIAPIRDTVSLRRLELAMMGDARQRRDDGVLHLKLGFLSLRLGDLAGRKHYEDAGSEFEWVVQLQPQWPYGWYGLGMAELGVGDSEVALVQGLQTMLGRDALTRSARAFAKSAEVDPEFVAGLVELTNTALRQRINTRLDVALAALRRAAGTPASRHPLVQLARGRVEREIGSLDSASAAINAILTSDPRNSDALLELARIRFGMGRLDGAEPYYRGLGVAGAAATASYRADLATIMPDSLLRRFDVASLAERVVMVRQFWASRDSDELHRPGERLREHYRRLDHAQRNFRLVTRNRQFDIAERYRSMQTEFDDRGVIYIRHGPPTERASHSAPQIEPNESWRYARDGGDLVFHFVARQDVQDYRLVESLFDVLGFQATVALRDGSDPLNQSALVNDLLRSREGLSPVYSRLIAGGRGSAAQIQTQERALGRRSIALGTTSDSWRLRYDAPLPTRIETVAVGHDSAGPSLQIAYAVQGAGLRPVATARGFAYPVRLRATVMALDGRTVATIDTTRVFVTAAEVPQREHLLGHLTLRVPPGTYTMRTAVETDRAGMVTTRDTVHVAGVDGPAIGLSDLAIGARNVNLPWLTASRDTAWANPLVAFQRRVPLQLYFEVGGIAAGTVFRTDIALLRPGGGSIVKRIFGGGGAAVRLGFDAAHPGGVATVSRELDLTELKAGNYVLEVVVSTRDGRRAVRRRTLSVLP